MHALRHSPPFSARALALARRSSRQLICGPEALEYWRLRFLEEWDDAQWLSKRGMRAYRVEYLRREGALLKVMSESKALPNDPCVRRSWEIAREVVADHKEKNMPALMRNGLVSSLEESSRYISAQASAREKDTGSIRIMAGLLELYITTLKIALMAWMRLLEEMSVNFCWDVCLKAQKELDAMMGSAMEIWKRDSLAERHLEARYSFTLDQRLLEAGLDWVMRALHSEAGKKLLAVRYAGNNRRFFAPSYFPTGHRLDNADAPFLMRVLTGCWHGAHLRPLGCIRFDHQAEGVMVMELECERDSQSPTTQLSIRGAGKDDIREFTIGGQVIIIRLEEGDDTMKNVGGFVRAGERVVALSFEKEYPTTSVMCCGALIAGGIVGAVDSPPAAGSGAFVLW